MIITENREKDEFYSVKKKNARKFSVYKFKIDKN